MNNHDSWERRTTALVAELHRLQRELEQRKERLQHDLRKADERISKLTSEANTLTLALDIYRQHMPSSATMDVSVSLQEIQNKTLREVLIMLAKQNNGIVIGRDAVRSLQQLGRFKTPEYADSEVYTLLNRVEDFEKVEPGIYRLVSNAHPDIETSRQPPLPVPRSASRRGMQIRAIVSQAQKQGGYIRYTEAVNLLLKLHLTGNPATVGLVAHSLLNKSGRFVRQSRGLYRLVG